MKLPPVSYLRPRDLAEAVAALSAHEGARPLAGGQSLIPTLADRSRVVSHLVDLTDVGELHALEIEGDVLVLGAGTRQRDLVVDPRIRRHAPLLADAAALVGNPAVRSRGTLGGALAHALPAGELVVATLALGADVDVVGPSGRRRIPVEQLVVGPCTTTLARDELIVAVRLPAVADGRGAIEEVTRRAHDAPVVCVAAHRVDGGRPRVACGGASPGARRLRSVERVPPGDDQALEEALGADLAPSSDLQGTAAYRRHVAGVLVRRVLARVPGGKA